MIQILGIAGSPVKEGNTEALLKEALSYQVSPQVKNQYPLEADR